MVKHWKRRNKLYYQDVYCHVNKHSIPQWTANTEDLRRHDQSNHIVTSIAAALNFCGNGLIRGVPPQHRMFAQRWADAINMWSNAVGTFKRPLAGVQVYTNCLIWVTVGFIIIWIKYILKTLKKIKSWSVGCTTSLHNLKQKLMSSQGAALTYCLV